MTTIPGFILAVWAVTPLFFFAGAALISLPILIHFLNRRRFKTVKWAAMEYLLSAMRKNRRRVKFEQMLLLATRCLILLLLGLALARPLGCADSTLASMAGQRTGLHVFVIDNSYSMAYEAERPEAKTHLDQAKKLAKQQIERLASGTEAVVVIAAAGPVTAADPKSLVIASPSYDLDAAKAAVDRIEQSYAGTDMVGALQLAVEVARMETRQPTKFLYVLTDFTRSAWGGDREGEAEELRNGPNPELMKQAGRDVNSVFGSRVRINDLGKPGQWNYAILAVRPDGNLVTSEFHTDFFANVKGFGPGPETLLQWTWDEQVLPESARLKPDTTTPPQRQTKVQLKGQGGTRVLAAQLVNDERLKVDNTRWRVVEVASELKVLIVEGERGTSLLSGSGSYLDLSLAPRKEVGPTGAMRSDTYVLPEVVSDLELGNKVLGDYRALILTNVGSISPNQADQIETFVRQGGTLMVFMGEQINPDNYNSVMLPRGLMPGKLVARKVAPDNKGFTMDFRPDAPVHPLLDLFKGQKNSGLDTARIFTYYQAELAPASKAEVVLGYLSDETPTNDPAITVQTLGDGRVAFVSTTANPDWTGLPAKPAYTALMHELLAGTVDVGDRWMNLEVGQAIEVPAGLRLTSTPALTDPSKKQLPIDAVSRDGRTVYRSRPIDKPGLYQLNTGARTYPVAVNVPAEEADIRLLPAESIRKALGDIDIQLYGDAVPAGALARDDRSDFGWMFMLGLLGLVGAECLMAMRFGHYRRPQVTTAA